MKALILLTAFLTVDCVADYQMQLEAAVEHNEVYRRNFTPGPASLDGYQAWQVEGIFYFQPVATANLPLADAAFLSKNSSVELGFMKEDSDEYERGSGEAEINTIFAARWIAGASYLNFDEDTRDYSYTQKGPGVLLGAYIGKSSAVQLHYRKTTFDVHFDNPELFLGVDTFDMDVYMLSSKHILMADGRAHSDIELELTKDINAVELNANVGWYWGDRLKIGVAAGVTDYDFGAEHSFSAWAEYFVGERFALSTRLGEARMGELNERTERSAAALGIKFRI